MKKLLVMVLVCMMALSLAACSGNKAQERSQSSEAEGFQSISESSSEVSTEESNDLNMLVAYFSYAENADLPDGVDASATASIRMWNDELTGNTGVVADMIAKAAGAELFSIQTVKNIPTLMTRPSIRDRKNAMRTNVPNSSVCRKIWISMM